MAQEIHKMQITEEHKMITLDIKDLYVNMPKNGIFQSLTYWLDRNNTDKTVKTQIMKILEVILDQNYFQHDEHIFKPNKGIAMGSPISSTIAEIYLQHIEELYIKHWLEHGEIIYYKRY